MFVKSPWNKIKPSGNISTKSNAYRPPRPGIIFKTTVSINNKLKKYILFVNFCLLINLYFIDY
jgi:hypothetical protein